MDITQLQYFVLVAENGSTAKAAAEARVSQSTVSKSLLRLERELGIDLFDRQGTHLVLNPAGQEFLQQARTVISAFRRLPETVHQVRRLQRRYRINVSAAESAMAGFIHEFLKQEPAAELVMTGGNWIDDCDLSISGFPSGRQEDNILLLREEIRLAVPGAMLAEERDAIDISELGRLKLILPAEGSAFRIFLNRAMQGIPVTLAAQAVVPGDEIIRKLVEAGDGAAFWPQKTWPAPERDGIRMIDIKGLNLRREIYAQLPPNRSRNTVEPLLSALVRYFEEL